jgi:hypothetical protein
MHLQFVENESTFDYFAATRAYLERYGKPVAFYSDKLVIRCPKTGRAIFTGRYIPVFFSKTTVCTAVCITNGLLETYGFAILVLLNVSPCLSRKSLSIPDFVRNGFSLLHANELSLARTSTGSNTRDPTRSRTLSGNQTASSRQSVV